MAKTIFCVALCFLAVTNVFAVTEEEKQAIRAAMTESVAECSKQYGVTTEDIKAAKKSKNVDSIDSCFLGCVLKKVGWINDKTEFDEEAAMVHVKKYFKNEEDVKKISEIGTNCAKVNSEPVGDDAEKAVCERAKLLMTCILEHKSQFPTVLS